MHINPIKNFDGSHTSMAGGIPPEGWVFVPDNIDIPNSFPFVNIEIAEVKHPENRKVELVFVGDEVVQKEKIIPAYTQLEVISMTEGEEIIFEQPETPTQLDRIEAQVTYTAMLTDTLLEE